MNITSKSRYGIKIMLDMAFHGQDQQLQRRDISKRQGVPGDYLDQIINRLRHAGLVTSVRGRGGGYILARQPHEITVYDVFSAVEDHFFPVECVSPDTQCDFSTSCISHHGWQEIFNTMIDSLKNITLGALLEKGTDVHHLCPMGGVRECRPGKVQHL